MPDDSNNSDPDLSGMPVTITLLLSEWRTVLAHLQTGTYQVVAPVIERITVQATPQLEAVQQAARQEAAEKAAPPDSTAEARIH